MVIRHADVPDLGCGVLRYRVRHSTAGCSFGLSFGGGMGVSRHHVFGAQLNKYDNAPKMSSPINLTAIEYSEDVSQRFFNVRA